MFPVLRVYLSNMFLLLYEQVGTSTSRGDFFFVFSGSCSKKQAYGTNHIPGICNVVLFCRFWGTLLRPTAGAVVLIRKCTSLKNVPCLHIVRAYRRSPARVRRDRPPRHLP